MWKKKGEEFVDEEKQKVNKNIQKADTFVDDVIN